MGQGGLLRGPDAPSCVSVVAAAGLYKLSSTLRKTENQGKSWQGPDTLTLDWALLILLFMEEWG